MAAGGTFLIVQNRDFSHDLGFILKRIQANSHFRAW